MINFQSGMAGAFSGRGLATNRYRLGVPDKKIQTILRHAKRDITMNIYVKTVSEDSIVVR
jgi:hypothetical protein